MALLTKKTIFIHVPKTGGSSIRTMIRKGVGFSEESGDFEIEDHYGLPELMAAHPGINQNRLTFGFVRHPVAWLKSRWAWAVISGLPQKAQHIPSAAGHWMSACWSDNFETFAGNYLDRYPGVCTQTMFRMLGLWSDAPVNKVGKTEYLVTDLEQIFKEAGERIDAAVLRACAREKVAATGPLYDRCIMSSVFEKRVMDAEAALCNRFDYW